VIVVLVPAGAMAQTPEPVRVGGNIQAPSRTAYVAPIYPVDARNLRVGGAVIAEAVIGTDGRVSDVRILRSIPMLDQAALEAIRQWTYTPTMLNGVPVPVMMTVTVNFTPDMSDSTESRAAQTANQANQNGEANQPPVTVNGSPAYRIGGDLKAPERVTFVPPVYPTEAQSAKVSGTVIIEALIDQQGFVTNAKILKSVALLDQAALDAVMQWRYLPTLLNGAAVPVIMTVTVNFTLQ